MPPSLLALIDASTSVGIVGTLSLTGSGEPSGRIENKKSWRRNAYSHLLGDDREVPIVIRCSKCGGVIYEGDLVFPADAVRDKNLSCPVCGRKFTPDELNKMIETLKISSNPNWKKLAELAAKPDKWLQRVMRRRKDRAPYLLKETPDDALDHLVE